MDEYAAGRTPLDFSDALRILAAFISSKILWRRRRTDIGRVFSTISHWKAEKRPEVPLEELYELVRKFHAVTPLLFSTQDECLFRSLFLVRFLALSGIPSELVIGVRTSPFLAHCWAEANGEVLNEHLETTLRFTKIASI